MSLSLKTANHVEDLALLTRHIAGAMAARAFLPETLRAFARESEGGRLSRAAARIADRVESGLELSAALAEYPGLFPSAYIRLVRLGEQGRTLGGVMGQLADTLEEGLKTYEFFRRAAIYPLVIIVLLFVDIAFILEFISPKIVDMHAQLGYSAAEFGGVANRVMTNIPGFIQFILLAVGLLLLGPGLYLAATVAGLRVSGFGAGRFTLSLPLVGPVLRRAEVSRFATNLALLLRNYVPLADALGLLVDSSENTYVRAAIQQFHDRFQRGERLGELFASQPLFPPTMAVMIASAEDEGGLVETLQTLGRYYGERTAHGLTVLREVFEPLMLVLVGVLVALILLAIYYPMFNMFRMLV